MKFDEGSNEHRAKSRRKHRVLQSPFLHGAILALLALCLCLLEQLRFLAASSAWLLFVCIVGASLFLLHHYQQRALLSALRSSRRKLEGLRNSERQFRAITERAPDAIVVVDQQGRIVLVNLQTERLFGYAREEILGQPVEVLVPAAARQHHAAHRGRYTADPHFRKMGEGLELKGLHKSGSDFPIEISLSPVLTPSGQWVASSIRDISARKQMEFQLQQSKDRFESLLESAPDGMLVVNESGTIVFANAQAEALFGYSRQELVGTGLWILLPHRARPSHDQLLREFFVSGRARQMGPGMDLSGLRKDGSEFPVDISLSPIRGVGEHWVCAAVRDVTQRRKVECELRESALAIQKLNTSLEARIEERTGELRKSEQLFRLMVERVQDYAILMLDTQGCVVTWNLGAERITGYTAEQIIGRHFSVFRGRDGADEETDQILVVAAECGHCEQQGWRIRRDGTRFWANKVISAVHDDTGRLCGFSAVIQDITVRKNAMEQLEAERTRAEDANRAKSDFLAVMSHEIRTPMNAILGMADLLYESALSSEQRQYVEIFRRAGMNLLILINDLLDVSKIESGHLVLDSVEFNLEELVEQIVELVASKARGKGIGLHLSLDPAIPTLLRGDPLRLRQVLLNLLGNAIKFTESGEVVLTVTCNVSNPSGSTSNPAPTNPAPTNIAPTNTAPTHAALPEFTFHVRDTGIGIDEAHIHHIFDDFTQADASITRRFGGSGLGLSISRRVVEIMGGRIQVASKPGQGSQFWFTVPLQPLEAGKPGPPAELTELTGLRTLVLDNNSTNRLILRGTLQTWGMKVDEFQTAEDTLAGLHNVMASSQPYALALLDHHMPGMDGFSAASAIRRLAPNLPMIMLSSDTRPGDETRIREAGFSSYGVLPIRRADLLRLVRAALKVVPPAAPPHSGLTLLPLARAAAQPLRILIAEDSEDNRLVIRLYLANLPHTLTFAENGQQAIQEFQKGNFDLVFLDIQMPVLDGHSAARHIREIEEQRGSTPVPILALSANARERDVRESLSAGCNGHVSKPVSKASLLIAIEHYCRQAPSPAYNDPNCVAEIQEFFPRYLRSRRAELPHIAGLLEQREFDHIRRMAHDLKGTGANFGYPHLSELGRLMQDAAESRDSASLSRHYAELADYLWRLSA